MTLWMESQSPFTIFLQLAGQKGCGISMPSFGPKQLKKGKKPALALKRPALAQKP